KPATTARDVYALGVLFYQLVVGDLTRPLGIGWEQDVEDELLREDIGMCVVNDPARRTASPIALAERLAEIDERARKQRKDRRISPITRAIETFFVTIEYMLKKQPNFVMYGGSAAGSHHQSTDWLLDAPVNYGEGVIAPQGPDWITQEFAILYRIY